MMERGPGGTVLVVDDQEDLRRLLVLALERHDFDVLEAGSGEAAMEILTSRPVDVLVLDMGLPGMQGTAVVQALRQRPETATLPVLLMTGSGTDRSVLEGLEAGADDFRRTCGAGRHGRGAWRMSSACAPVSLGRSGRWPSRLSRRPPLKRSWESWPTGPTARSWRCSN